MAKRIPLSCETFFAPWQRWFEVRAFPAETGGISVYFADITSRKQAEERQHLLIRELHHRVKNTLATVQALAGASMRSASSLEAFRTGFADRLVSLGRTHGLLTENAWEGADLDTLLRLELAPFDDGSGARVRISGPAVQLPSEMAVAFGMALHELATNAAQHGSLSVASGSVEVTWTVETRDAQQHVCLTWVERGGPPVVPPGQGGFGTQLLQRLLSAQMNGRVEIDYAPEGARVLIEAIVPVV
jgi:two-component sensor histidine kinase